MMRVHGVCIHSGKIKKYICPWRMSIHHPITFLSKELDQFINILEPPDALEYRVYTLTPSIFGVLKIDQGVIRETLRCFRVVRCENSS